MGPVDLTTKLERSGAASSADGSVSELQETERVAPETGLPAAVAQATESPGRTFMGDRTPEARAIARPDRGEPVPVRHTTDWIAGVANDKAVAGLLGLRNLEVPAGRNRGPGHMARIRSFRGSDLQNYYANMGHAQPSEILAVIAIVNALAPRIASGDALPSTEADKRALVQQALHIARSPGGGPVALPDPIVMEILSRWFDGAAMNDADVTTMLEFMGGDTPENRAKLEALYGFLATGMTDAEKEAVEVGVNSVIPPPERYDEEEHLAERTPGRAYRPEAQSTHEGVDWLAGSSMTAHKRYQQSGEADLADARRFADDVAEQRRAVAEFEVSREAGAPKNRGPA